MLKKFLPLGLLTLFFFYLNYLLHMLFTLAFAYVQSDVSPGAFPFTFGQALRVTTFVNLFVFAPFFVILVNIFYKKWCKWLKVKPFSHGFVLVFSYIIISFVALPFLFGLFLDTTPDFPF